MTRPEDLAVNRELWDELNGQFAAADGMALWRSPAIVWGLYAAPEEQLGVLGEVGGLDVVELGCGVAHVSAWLARRGARVVGVDLSMAQLASARMAQWSTAWGVCCSRRAAAISRLKSLPRRSRAMASPRTPIR